MKTLKLRIKDKHCKMLDQLAVEVNFVWNYVNDLCFKHLQRKQQFFSAYDIAQYTKGTSKECNLHSQTIQAIAEELVTRRKQFKKAKLKWRVSNNKSARRSLGWIPFKKVAIKYADGYVQYGKHQFKLWDSYGLSKYNVKTGSFVEDHPDEAEPSGIFPVPAAGHTARYPIHHVPAVSCDGHVYYRTGKRNAV